MRPEHLQAYLNQIDSNFDRFDTAKAEEHLGELRRRLPCLTTVIDQQDLVRLARQQAALAFFSQDIWEMARWGHAADTVLPEHPWPDGFGEDHPMRQQLVLLETVAIVGPEERFLAPPRGGGIFWNGVLLTEPKAPLETPGLVQMAGHTGEVVFSYWQDGGAFREEVLAPAGSRAKTIKPPSWWGPKDTPKTPKASSMLVSLSLVGGFGSTGQKPDSPGNFLPEVGEANGMLQITGQQPELVVEGDVVMMESSRLESAPELTASATAPTRPGFANPKDEKMVAPWDGMNLPTGLGEVIYCDDTALNVKYNFDVIVRQEALAELYTGAIEKQGWTKDIESIDSSNDVAVNFKKNGQTLVLSAAFQQFDRKFLVSMVLLDF